MAPLLVGSLLLLGACSDALGPPAPAAEDTDAVTPDVDCAEPGDWASVGQPFVLSYCTGCHSAHKAEGERFGAPVDIDFDTIADTRTHATRGAARVEAGTMPPGAGPTSDEAARFLRWMACGAPGTANPMGGGTAAPAAGDTVADLESAATPDAVDPELLVLERRIRQSSDYRTGLLSRHYYVTSGAEGWLVAIEEYDEEEALIRGLELDPPLQVTGDNTAGEHRITVQILDNSGESTQELVWSVEVQRDPVVDPRITGAPLRVLAVADGGLELSWLLDERDGMVGQTVVWPDGGGQTHIQGSGGLGLLLEGDFPIVEGLITRELVLFWSTP